MPVACLGIDHSSSPVALRERLAFTPGEQRRALWSPAARRLARDSGIGELVILSTCNRTELYAAAQDVARPMRDVSPALARVLSETRAVDVADFAAHLYGFEGAEAVRHLCRVATGLDSMVLGESEILGQVSAAGRLAEEEGSAGPILNAAFRAAVRSGRRARSETGIGRYRASVSSEAVRLLRDAGCDLALGRVLIIGTGKVGRLAGEVLRSYGASRMTVVSRTAAHAETLARELGATPRAWHELAATIREADAVISSTGAPHAVVTYELMETALRAREPGRPLVVVDIAVPRDVEPAVGTIPGVVLYDLDGVQARIGHNLAEREREIPAVERIVEEEVARFEEWRRAAALRPLLAAMRARGDEIRRRELERLFHRLDGAPPATLELIERFSESLVSKLLHEPTLRLRREADQSRSGAYARVARELFGLGNVVLSEEAGVDAA
jgi:glutamyl-tRNA reductase